MSGGQPWPEWRKPHLGSTWRGDEWNKKVRCAVTWAPNLISVLCVCWCGCAEARTHRGHTDQHLYGLLQRLSQRLRVNTSNKRNAKHARTSTEYTTNAALQTNTVTYKPFTHKHTSMSGYNACGHEQIGTWFHRTNGNRRVITPTYPLSSPWKERKRFGVSFPTEDPRSFRPSWCFTCRQPDTWPENTMCHAQTVDYRYHRTQALRRGRNSSLENFPRPANIPQPKLPLAQYSPQNLEGTPRCKVKPAPHPSSWEPFGGASQSQVLDRRLSCRHQHSMKLRYVLPAR